MLNEADLVRGLARGDEACVREFLERSHDAVYAYSCRISSDPESRRDWVHDSLLRIVEDLKTGRFEYRYPGSFWSWFRKRAYFLVVEFARRDRRHHLRLVSGGESVDAAEATVSVEAEVERAEVFDAVERCLAAIEHLGQRDALRLMLEEDLRYREIAERLDTSLNNVRTWVRRGRLLLRQCMATRLGLSSAPAGEEG